MRVFDCFTFFNEIELLELRLETFWDLVDYFVIVEANKTHANIPKPFNFLAHKDKFKKYLKKIRYIMDDSVVPYKGVGDWSIENNQRNNILQGLQDAEPDDLIFISDLDEFPNPQTMQTLLFGQFDKSLDVEVMQYFYPEEYSSRTIIPFQCMIRAIELLNYCPLVCKMRFHGYFFDWVSVQNDWEGTVIGKFKFMNLPQDFRNARRKLPRIVEGGWHFSYMGGIKRLLEKMYSAVECKELVEQDSRFGDADFLQQIMQNGKYIFGEQFVRCDVNDISIPYLKKFLEKYPQFLQNKVEWRS